MRSGSILARMLMSGSPAMSLDWQTIYNHLDCKSRADVRGLGLLGAGIPVCYGGIGGGLSDLCLLFELAGERLSPLPLFGHLAVAAQAILAGGSEDQRQRWLPVLAKGEAIASDGYCPELRIEDGVLVGTAPNVPHGAIADVLLVSSDIGTWLVETDQTGVALSEVEGNDLPIPTFEIAFSGASAEPLFDHDKAGLALHRSGYLALAAIAAGGTRRCLELAYQNADYRWVSQIAANYLSAQIVVGTAAVALETGAIDGNVLLHHAKARAGEALLDSVRLLSAEPARESGLLETIYDLATGIENLMGPASWHRGQAAIFLAASPRPDRSDWNSCGRTPYPDHARTQNFASRASRAR